MLSPCPKHWLSGCRVVSALTLPGSQSTRWVCAARPSVQHTNSRHGINALGLSGLSLVRVLWCLCAELSVCVKGWDSSPLLSASPNIVMLRNFQHPDGMMNSLNQPQDVIVSTHKALDLCLDWDWDYVCGNFIYAVNKSFSLSLEFGKHSVIKKDLLIIPFSKLMKLFLKALWKFITVPQKLLSW